MKKISMVSLVALLAATPMMAEAARTVSKINYNNGQAVTEDTGIASVSYVKGAYKSAADQIDKLIDDTAVNALASGSYNAIVAGNTVSENLKALDTEFDTKQDQLTAGDSNIQTAVKTATGTNAISAVSSYATASDSSLVTEKAVLTAINSAVSGVGNGVDTLIGDTDDLDGSAAGQTTIVGAINAKQDQLLAGDSEISSAVVQAENISSTINGASDTALVTEKAVVTAAQNAASAAAGNKRVRVFTEWGAATSALVSLENAPAE